MPSLLPFWRLSIEVEPGLPLPRTMTPSVLPGQLVGEGGGLRAVEDAGVELVLVDDAEAERLGLVLDALVGDHHRNAGVMPRWKAGTRPSLSSEVMMMLAPAAIALLTCSTWFSTE